MEIEELLRVRELLNLGPKPQAPPDLWERMARLKDEQPLCFKHPPLAPHPKIVAPPPVQYEEPKTLMLAVNHVPPAVDVQRDWPRTINLKPTAFSLKGVTRHD